MRPWTMTVKNCASILLGILTSWLLSTVVQAAQATALIELTAAQEYFLPQGLPALSVTAGSNPITTVPDINQPAVTADDATAPGAYWITFTVRNSTQEQEWMLDVSHALLQRIIVHSIAGTNHQTEQQGFAKDWPFDLRYGTRLHLAARDVTQVWIYLESPYPMGQPIFSLLPATDYQAKSSSYSMQLMIILGALVILALYQLVIFIPTRDPVYLWSALMQLSATIAWAAQCKALLYGTGLGLHWQWLFLPLFVSTTAAMQFARHYLRVHYPHPLAYALDGLAIVMLLVAVLAPLLSVNLYPWLLSKLLVISLLILVAAGVWRGQKQLADLRFYLSGCGLLLIGGLFYLLNDVLSLQLIENGILAAARLQLLAMVLLMLGLIDRMSLVRRERSQQIQRTGTDPITGLPNRPAFERDVRAWEAYCKEGIMKDFYLSFFEIRNLQELNRARGRKEGDRLLKLVGQWLLQQTGEHNVYRVGGNELLALTQRNIRWDLASLEKFLRQEGFRDTDIGVGSSCFTESTGRSSLLKMADERLQRPPR